MESIVYAKAFIAVLISVLCYGLWIIALVKFVKDFSDIIVIIAFIIISMIFGSNSNPIKENSYEERNTNIDGCRIISSI